MEINTEAGPQTVQLAEATLNQDGQIILTSDAANALAGGDGQFRLLRMFLEDKPTRIKPRKPTSTLKFCSCAVKVIL